MCVNKGYLVLHKIIYVYMVLHKIIYAGIAYVGIMTRTNLDRAYTAFGRGSIPYFEKNFPS